MKITSTLSSCALVALAFVLNGCSLGVVPVNIAHSPLAPVEKKQGTILVRRFADNRKGNHQYIGSIRAAFGVSIAHFGVDDGKPVDELVTDAFIGALQHAGYQAVRETAQASGSAAHTHFDAVLEGEISKFWLEIYVAAWQDVTVHLKLLDQQGQAVLWEKDIRSSRTTPLVRDHYDLQYVVQQAVDEALNRAAEEFASEAFYQKLKTGR